MDDKFSKFLVKMVRYGICIFLTVEIIRNYYILFTRSLSPSIHKILIYQTILMAIVSLICFLVYEKKKREEVSGALALKIKKFFLIGALITFALFIVDCIALIYLKPAPQQPGVFLPIIGGSQNQYVFLSDFTNIKIADLDNYEGKSPYFVKIKGTVDELNEDPNYQYSFIMRDAQGRTAIIYELGAEEGLVTENTSILRKGGTLTVLGALEITPSTTLPISPSTPAVIYVESCRPTNNQPLEIPEAEASDFICL